MSGSLGDSRHRPWVLVAALAAALLGLSRPAWARHHRGASAGPAGGAAVRHHAEVSPGAGAQQALAAGDITGAYQALELAYRARPSAEILFWLGRVAEAEKRPVAAQDYMRRFLMEAGADKDEAAAALRVQAQKLAEQSTEGATEARIVGPKGGLLLVDGRLAGTLPLPGTLLLAAGAHALAIETKRKRLDGKVQAIAGRGIEVLFDLEASAVLVSQQPLVLVLRVDRGVAAADQARLTVATREALSKARCSAVQAAEALRGAPELRGCLAEIGCALRLADKNGLDYALRLAIESKPGPAGPAHPEVSISAAVLDVAVGAVAAQVERKCSDCTSEATAAALREAVGRVVEAGLGRPRGTLLIESEPPGATVKVDGRLAGLAPLRRDVLAGEHTIDLSAGGQESASERIRVEPSEKKTLRVRLAAELPETEPPPALALAPASLRARLFYPRPRWRLLAGGAAVGAGLVLAGVGIGALSLNGQCVTPAVAPMLTCGFLYSTEGLGGGLLAAGLVLTLSGAGLVLWPGPRPAEPPPLVRAAAPDAQGSTAPRPEPALQLRF